MADDCPTLGTIKKQCGLQAAPGLKTVIEIAGIQEVLSIPAPSALEADGHTITDDIVMRASEVGPPAVAAGLFKRWPIESKDAVYKSEAQGDGESSLCTLTFMIKRMNPLSAAILNMANGGEFIVLFKDKTDSPKRILGDIDDGARFVVTEQTGDKNGYICTVTWTTGRLPYYYTGVVAV